MDMELKKALSKTKSKVAADVIGSSLSSFKSGGKISLVVSPNNENELMECVKLLENARQEYKIVGNCSNILIDDDGYEGVLLRTTGINKIESYEQTREVQICSTESVICDDDEGLQDAANGTNKIYRECEGENAEFPQAERNTGDKIIYVETGVKLANLVRWCANSSLSGLEWAAGIPGCVGGACYQNAGCFGYEIANIVDRIRFIENGKFVEYGGEDLCFSYRHSVMQERQLLCVGAYLKMKSGGYYDIAKQIDEFRKKRLSSQPKEPSLGSVFKRVNGLSAAHFIDKLSLKDCSVGGAYIAPEHAGFICNNGFATSSDFLHLARFAQKEVLEKEGIFFPLEIEYLGKTNDTYNRLIGK